MESYKISKAWHLGHEVAESIHYLMKLLPEDAKQIAGELRCYSASVPHLITASVAKKSKVHKLKCYEYAREATVDLLEVLDRARNQKYIDQKYYDEQAKKVIEAQKQLTHVIRKVKMDLATAEKEKKWH